MLRYATVAAGIESSQCLWRFLDQEHLPQFTVVFYDSELNAVWHTFEPKRSISVKASHASLTQGSAGINHGSCFVQSEWR